MCLAIPGKIVELFAANDVPMARVEFGNITRQACVACVPDAGVGDYVLVHVGFAISKVDEEEAARTYELLEQMGQLGELDDSDSESSTGNST